MQMREKTKSGSRGRKVLRFLIWVICLFLVPSGTWRSALAQQTPQQQQQEREREQEQQREEQQRQQQEEQQRQQQEEQQRQQREEQQRQQREEQQRQQQEEQQRQQQEEQQRQQREEQERQQQRQQQNHDEGHPLPVRPPDPVLQHRPVEPEPDRPVVPEPHPVRPIGPAVPDSPDRPRPPVDIAHPPIPARPPDHPDHPIPYPIVGVPIRPGGPVGDLRLPPPPPRRPEPARPPVVVTGPTVVVRPHPVQVVVAPSASEVLAIGPPAPRIAVVPAPVVVVNPQLLAAQNPVQAAELQMQAAQTQMQAAQNTCAQADAYQGYVNTVINTQNTTDQGINQILQTLVNNTSDPNVQQALEDSMNQPNPINDTLQQQLQNQANTFQGACQTKMTAAQNAQTLAQAQLAAAEQSSPQSVPPQSLLAPGAVPATNTAQADLDQRKAAALMTAAQTAMKNGDAATANRLTQQAQIWQAASGNPAPVRPPAAATSGSGFPLKVTWGSSPVLKPMFVSFSFATPTGFADDPTFGGDGEYGVSISPDEQSAINFSGNDCAGRSSRPSWCGNGNGGTWQVCRADGKSKWVALAITTSNIYDWSDGEVIAGDTEPNAEQGAVANCGKQSCQLVWSALVDCTHGAYQVATTGGVAGGGGSGPQGASPTGASGAPPVQPGNGTNPTFHCPYKVCAGEAN